MNQVLNTDNDITNAKLDASSEAGLEAASRACLKANFDLNNTNKTDMLFKILAIKVDKSQISRKKKHKSNKSDIAKQVNLSNKIFEYIYIA